MKIGAAIMSGYMKPRPDRVAAGRSVAERLGSLYVDTITTRTPTATTARLAWRRLLEEPGLTHALVTQDDVLLSPSIEIDLPQWVAAYPDQVLSLCYQRVVGRKALPVGWVRTRGMLGQGILAPIDIAAEFVAWEQRYILPSYVHDDGRWQFFLLFTGRWAYAGIPSLATHRLDLRSSMGHHNPNQPGRTPVAFKETDERLDWIAAKANLVHDQTGVWSTGSHGRQLGLLRRTLGAPPRSSFPVE